MVRFGTAFSRSLLSNTATLLTTTRSRKLVFLLQATLEQCRYFHVPVGNVPKDTTIFGADLFFARHLRKQNFVLWFSESEKPDLGGELFFLRQALKILALFPSCIEPRTFIRLTEARVALISLKL